jgi:GAF domain-containing protein
VTDPALWELPGLNAQGFSSAVVVPIVAGGRLWGAIGVGSQGKRLPPDTAERLAGFIGLRRISPSSTAVFMMARSSR